MHKKTASPGGETVFFYFPFAIFIMTPIIASIKQGAMNFIALIIRSIFSPSFLVLASLALWEAPECSLLIHGSKGIMPLIFLWSFLVLLVRALYIAFGCILLLGLLVLELYLCLLLWLLIVRIFPYF